MTADRWNQVYELFKEVLPLSAEERKSLLDARSSRDPELRAAVERLLAHDVEAEQEDFLAPPEQTDRDGPGVVPPEAVHLHCPHCGGGIELVDQGSVREVQCPTCRSTFPVGRHAGGWKLGTNRVGRFELLEPVGTGGFGTVYRAYDPELERIVAVKVLRAGNFASDETLRRFMEDARSAAQLHHRSIVPVYDASEHEGVPFIVRDFIRGVTLADSLRHRRPSFGEAARLATELADALQYAHENGVIHRDVKSQNIMLDEDGQPHLMDFGLAKRQSGEFTVTMHGEVLGTPAFMPPEQARGEGNKADEKSDIYSLGVVLYQMITGELPFRGTNPMLLNQVMHDEPRPPRRLNDQIPRDLETICLKAMAKEPSHRYAMARDLAEDLRRFQDGRPIEARPAGTLERIWRWCRRNPSLASALGMTAAALVAAALFGLLFGLDRSLRLGESMRHLAIVNLELGLDACQRGDVGPGLHMLHGSLRAASAAGDVDLGRVARHNLAAWKRDLPGLLAVFSHGGEVASVAFSPDGGTILTASADRTGRLWDAASGAPIGAPLQHEFPLGVATFRPDGQAALTTDRGGHVRLWDAQTGALIHDLEGHHGEVLTGAFSRDGKLLATAGADTAARLWDGLTGRSLRVLTGHTGQVNSLAVSADGRSVLTGSADHAARIWDAASGQLRGAPLLHEREVYWVDLSPDGAVAVTASRDQTARLWEVATGRLLRTLHHDGEVWVAVFSPDGALLATGGEDRTARLWETATGQPRGKVLRHADRVGAIAFDPSGKRLLTGSWDHTARLWDVATGRGLGLVFRHQGRVGAVSFAPDGKAVLTAGGDRTARLWRDEPAEGSPMELPRRGAVRIAAYSPGGERIALGTHDGEVVFCDARTGRPLGQACQLGDSVCTLTWSPDGKLVAAGGDHGQARLWSAADGRPVGDPVPFAERVNKIAFSTDGRTLVYGCVDGTLRFCESRSGQARGEPLSHGKPVPALAFSPDGTTVATAGLDGLIRFWDPVNGATKGRPLQHPNMVLALAFSPDGRSLLSGSADNLARRWDLASGKDLGRLPGHQGAVVAVAFSRDGKILATGSTDGEARLWDAGIRARRGLPLKHLAAIVSLAFSPDGRLVLTGSQDGTARLWDTATGRPIGPPLNHPHADSGPCDVYHVEFRNDGNAVMTCCTDLTARVWSIPLPTGQSDRREWVEAETGLELHEDGGIGVLDTASWTERRKLSAMNR